MFIPHGRPLLYHNLYIKYVHYQRHILISIDDEELICSMTDLLHRFRSIHVKSSIETDLQTSPSV